MLDGFTLGEIWVGNIEWWNDPGIQRLNPSVELPNERILLIYANDSVGTLGSTFGHALSLFNSNFAAAWSIVNANHTAQWALIPGISNRTVFSEHSGPEQIDKVQVR